jgi:hypothetical protein
MNTAGGDGWGAGWLVKQVHDSCTHKPLSEVKRFVKRSQRTGGTVQVENVSRPLARGIQKQRIIQTGAGSDSQ